MADVIPPSCKRRIRSDIKLFYKSPPPGLFIEPDESDFLTVHSIIIGPDDTPYKKGFFYFVLKFPTNYPHSPPLARFMNTDNGTVRMNPNLYADGKVCLSILGTWPCGAPWSPQLSITSVLLSIQSLLNEHPYHNEPGFETIEKNAGDAMQYNEIILHETIRVAVIGMVRGDSGLKVPPSLEFIIQQEFAKNLDYYVEVASHKTALSGNVMMDPMYGERFERCFQYSYLLSLLGDMKNAMHIG